MYGRSFRCYNSFVVGENNVQLVRHNVVRIIWYGYFNGTRFACQAHFLNDKFDKPFKQLPYALSGLVRVLERVADTTKSLLDCVNNFDYLFCIYVLFVALLFNDRSLIFSKISYEGDEP